MLCLGMHHAGLWQRRSCLATTLHHNPYSGDNRAHRNPRKRCRRRQFVELQRERNVRLQQLLIQRNRTNPTNRENYHKRTVLQSITIIGYIA